MARPPCGTSRPSNRLQHGQRAGGTRWNLRREVADAKHQFVRGRAYLRTPAASSRGSRFCCSRRLTHLNNLGGHLAVNYVFSLLHAPAGGGIIHEYLHGEAGRTGLRYSFVAVVALSTNPSFCKFRI